MNLDEIFKESRDSVIITDDTGNIIKINDSTEKLTGFAREELVNKNIKIIMPSYIAEVHDDYILNYLSRQEGENTLCFGRELPIKTKEGKIVQILLTVCDSIVNGKHYFTGILRNPEKIDSSKQNVLKKLCMLDLSIKENLESLKKDGR